MFSTEYKHSSHFEQDHCSHRHSAEKLFLIHKQCIYKRDVTRYHILPAAYRASTSAIDADACPVTATVGEHRLAALEADPAGEAAGVGCLADLVTGLARACIKADAGAGVAIFGAGAA